MTIASLIFRRRRALALCAVSVLLHAVALWWAAPQLGLASAPPPAGAPVTIETRLLMAPPPADPVAAPVKLPRRPVPAPPLPTVAAVEVAIGAPVAPAQGGAAEASSEVQSGQPGMVEADPPAASVAPPPPAAPPAARQYRVDLPPSASITFDVTRTDADGTRWSGEALMAWQLKGERYRMKVEAGIRVLIARVNLVVLESEGAIGANGLAPATLTEKRRGRALTTTRFSERDRLITFSATPASSAWMPGAQDKATLPLQLAAIARGDSGQIEGGIELLVGEERDASLFRFVVLGQEQLDTGLGKLQTWHLSRPPRAGAYNSRLDIWLAPGRGWYPVQIRNFEASGAVTTQTANQITQAGT
jgi:hypothetical protein